MHVSTSGTAEDAVKELMKHKKVTLASAIVNQRLNKMISRFAFRNNTPIPFAGWYWRDVDFFGELLPTIADMRGVVVICESNKWDYRDRLLTEQELARFRQLVWDAYLISCEAGNVAEIEANTLNHLRLAGEFITGLEV